MRAAACAAAVDTESKLRNLAAALMQLISSELLHVLLFYWNCPSSQLNAHKAHFLHISRDHASAWSTERPRWSQSERKSAQMQRTAVTRPPPAQKRPWAAASGCRSPLRTPAQPAGRCQPSAPPRCPLARLRGRRASGIMLCGMQLACTPSKSGGMTPVLRSRSLRSVLGLQRCPSQRGSTCPGTCRAAPEAPLALAGWVLTESSWKLMMGPNSAPRACEKRPFAHSAAGKRFFQYQHACGHARDI